MNTRAAAANILLEVCAQGRALDAALSQAELATWREDDARFIQELCYGTLRWYPQLLGIAESLLHKPLAAKYQAVQCVLLVGLYQLIHLRTPAYAAIASTVEAAKRLKKFPWAPGLVNKILRLASSQPDKIQHLIQQHPAWRYAHPPWLLEHLQRDWPTAWEAIVAANNQPAPLTLRINPQQTTRESYLQILADHGITATPVPQLAYALQLSTKVAVPTLPGFAQGACYVQDEAGQWAGSLLRLAPGQRVLDACAAPGSKTTDILIREPALHELVAVDIDAERLEKIRENVTRLQLHQAPLTLLCADANALPARYPQGHFERILLDAPCSATGVIRRHPDIKVLRRPADIHTLAQRQLALLQQLWPLLAVDGFLLYATCSVLHSENEAVVDKFLRDTSNAQAQPLTLPGAVGLTHGCQLLPNPQGSDGFYYALIHKSA